MSAKPNSKNKLRSPAYYVVVEDHKIPLSEEQAFSLWKRWFEQVSVLAGAFLSGGDLIRQVGPGQPAEMRHEFQKPEYHRPNGGGPLL